MNKAQMISIGNALSEQLGEGMIRRRHAARQAHACPPGFSPMLRSLPTRRAYAAAQHAAPPCPTIPAAMVRVAGTLQRSTEVMKLVNESLKLPQMQRTMMEMSRGGAAALRAR